MRNAGSPPVISPRARLDRRAQRSGRPERHVSRLLPTQSQRRRPQRSHRLGARHQYRPRHVDRTAGRHRRNGRRASADRVHRRGHRQHLRPRHRRRTATGGDLHLGRRRRAGPVAGLQHRQRPDLAEVRRQPGPGARRSCREAPRSQGLLVRAGRLLGDGRSRHRCLQGAAVQVGEPDRLDVAERGLRRRRAGRSLGEPRPVPAGAGRRPGEHQVGDAGQHQLRRRPRAAPVSSTSSGPSTARPSPRSRSARPGSVHLSPARCFSWMDWGSDFFGATTFNGAPTAARRPCAG